MKLRGQRIELGEIEHALRALPGVDEAVVLVHAETLVAYVSPAELVQLDGAGEAEAEAAAPFGRVVAAEAKEGAAAVAAASEGGFGAAVPFGRVPALAGAAAALPAYMVPSVVVGVREWPRTSSAKIDRNRLPPPEGGSGAAAEVVAPRSAAERAARDAIAAVLGLPAEGVSVEAGFFELGGNSLSAVRLARRLTEALGRQVGVADVLQRPTAAALAADGSNDPAPTLSPLVQMVDATPSSPIHVPVSFQQAQMLTYQLVSPDSTMYNMLLPIPLPRTASRASVRGALKQLVRQHALLRSYYALDDATFSQIILPADGFEVPLVDDDEALQAPFDPLSSPPLRAQLLVASTGEAALVLSVHHVITDHQSMPIFVRHVLAFLADEAVAPLELQYADYALWQSQGRSEERVSAQLAWWAQHLAAVPPCMSVPLDAPRPPVQRSDSAKLATIEIDGATAARVHALCRAEGTTMNVALLALWGAYLSRRSGERTVVIAQPHSLRLDERLLDTIGYFHTVMPLVSEADMARGAAPLLRAMHQELLEVSK